MLELLNQLDGFEATKNIKVKNLILETYQMYDVKFHNYSGYHGHKQD